MSGHKNWSSGVKKLLNNYGFSEIFDTFNVYLCEYSTKSFPAIFKKRIIDCYKQIWFAMVCNNNVLEEYSQFKNQFLYESYLDLVPYDLRFFITKLRISAHTLRIHTGRFGENRLPRSERTCVYCTLNDVEDIYHFVCICPNYKKLRIKFIDRYFHVRPSVFKFNELLMCQDRKKLCNLALFIREAFKARNNSNMIVR